MRIVRGTALLVVGLALAQPAFAMDPLLLVRRAIGIPEVAQRPIVQPQQVQPRNTSLTGYLPKVMLPSNHPVHGRSIFPAEKDMPGKNYLRAFGFRRPTAVAPN